MRVSFYPVKIAFSAEKAIVFSTDFGPTGHHLMQLRHGNLRAYGLVMETTDQLVHQILQAARCVHGALGPGFIESIYGKALVIELKAEGLRVERERLIKIWYGSQLIGRHCLDIVVDDTVILELKASRAIIPVHSAQVRSYLHASHFSIGLILNFGMSELQFELIRQSEN